MRSSIHLLGALALVFGFAACGGDDDGDDGDGNPVIDAPGSVIDAPPQGTDAPAAITGLGQACTGAGQGDCPAGFTCLSLQGGSASWCSKMCDPQADTCDQGYTGPGLGACVFGITPAGGGPAQNFCGIICEDLAGAPDICPQECTGACPSGLQCTADLSSQAGVVARACI